MELNEVKIKLRNALIKLYNNDIFLIENNLGERCITHRLAVYLEQEEFPEYYVDCEYNKSHSNGETNQKVITSKYGNSVDIIITQRNSYNIRDLACFELKKWNRNEGRDKDRAKLKELTSKIRYIYNFGFFIIIGLTLEEVRIELYQLGERVEEYRID